MQPQKRYAMTYSQRRYAALFDLDGVLIDTEPVYTGIWTDIDSCFPTGYSDFAYRIKGTTLPNILATYFPDPHIQAKVVAMLKSREETMEYPLFDGVVNFLKALRDAGIPAAIVTSSGDAKMERLFATVPGFRDFFVEVITDSRVSRSKPHPEGYILGARLLGADPADSFVFEDSYNGLAAGRAAGATVVALATSNPAGSLAGKADAVINSFTGFTVENMLAIRRKQTS